MFGLFKGKKRLEKIEDDTKTGFESVKKDILSISEWIKHLDSKKNKQEVEINDLKGVLSSIQTEIENLKNVAFMFMDSTTNSRSNKVFKTNNPLSNKQTSVYAGQTAVQTTVQSPNLSNFSVTERAILFILLNTDMKLSYNDLSAMLNKEKSTIRGQINTIKSKSESLIEEIIEKNGKKRIFIPEPMKEKLLKKQKVRVGSKKESKSKRE